MTRAWWSIDGLAAQPATHPALVGDDLVAGSDDPVVEQRGRDDALGIEGRVDGVAGIGHGGRG